MVNAKGKEKLKMKAAKEHKEHQKNLKPLLKHLKSDEKKIAKGKM